jgi:hypothetical protein
VTERRRTPYPPRVLGKNLAAGRTTTAATGTAWVSVSPQSGATERRRKRFGRRGRSGRLAKKEAAGMVRWAPTPRVLRSNFHVMPNAEYVCACDRKHSIVERVAPRQRARRSRPRRSATTCAAGLRREPAYRRESVACVSRREQAQRRLGTGRTPAQIARARQRRGTRWGTFTAPTGEPRPGALSRTRPGPTIVICGKGVPVQSRQRPATSQRDRWRPSNAKGARLTQNGRSPRHCLRE